MKVDFEDGSVLEVNERWIECIQIKYGMTWDEYWSQMEQVIDGLWDKGKVWTKFGIDDMKGWYEYEKDVEAEEDEEDEEERIFELNRAWHADQCIYTDVRACLMGLALKSLSEEGEKIPKVIGIADDEVHVYDGEEMMTVKSLDEVL